MFRKNYFTFLWVIVLFLSAGLTVSAQTAPVRGRVELKKADGTIEKLNKATIDVYRTDAKGKLPSDKTDKNGAFGFAGFTAGQTFALVVSAPGIKSEILPNVRAGMENIVITVYEGDGKRWTEDEVRTALAGSANAAAVSVEGKTQTAEKSQLTAEQKKAEAEYQKEVADITARNEKIKSTSASIQKSLTEGNNAYKEKNYDLAISKFDEGINAEPDFAGSAPVLLNAKGAALKEKGYISYSQGTKSTDAAIKASMFESAKKDWTAAVDSLNKGLAILKTATAPDAEVKKNYDTNKGYLLTNLVEVHRLMSKSGVDRSKAVEAKAAYEEYFTVETDAAAKAKAQLTLGDIMRENGDFESAVAAYRKTLETTPDNPDALAGLGLSLFALGASVQPENIAQEQEGLNYLQRFTEVAPESHPLKVSVKESVDYLKSKSLTPQKTPKSAPGKKKP
jgi:tetratricopeptide (TPR) repeat protein